MGGGNEGPSCSLSKPDALRGFPRTPRLHRPKPRKKARPPSPPPKLAVKPARAGPTGVENSDDEFESIPSPWRDLKAT